MVKSDAKVVVDCVNALQKIAVLEPVVLDICPLLNCFNFSSLLFHGRDCNAHAHNLAIIAYVVSSRT